MNGVLAAEGLNVSLCQALSALAGDVEMTMRQLARQLGITEGAATSVVDRLIRDGLMERRRDEKDRRIVKVRLTERGGEALTRDLGRLTDFWGAVLEHVDPGKRTAFFEVYEQLLSSAEQRAKLPPTA
jgi:DNA-binding MarR family transcriptional regulator